MINHVNKLVTPKLLLIFAVTTQALEQWTSTVDSARQRDGGNGRPLAATLERKVAPLAASAVPSPLTLIVIVLLFSLTAFCNRLYRAVLAFCEATMIETHRVST